MISEKHLDVLTHHIPRMHLSSQILQIVRRAKMRIDSIDVRLPISVICRAIGCVAFELLGHRGYPNRIEAHALDVVELVDDALPGAIAVDANPGITSCGR